MTPLRVVPGHPQNQRRDRGPGRRTARRLRVGVYLAPPTAAARTTASSGATGTPHPTAREAPGPTAPRTTPGPPARTHPGNLTAQHRILLPQHETSPAAPRPREAAASTPNALRPHRYAIRSTSHKTNQWTLRRAKPPVTVECISEYDRSSMTGSMPDRRGSGADQGRFRDPARARAIGYRHRQYGVAGGKARRISKCWRRSGGRARYRDSSPANGDDDGRTAARRPRRRIPCRRAHRRIRPSARQWLRDYLDAYLVPVLHSFYAYGLVYMRTGRMYPLLGEGGTVRRMLFKDIAEEIAVLDRTRRCLRAPSGSAPRSPTNCASCRSSPMSSTASSASSPPTWTRTAR